MLDFKQHHFHILAGIYRYSGSSIHMYIFWLESFDIHHLRLGLPVIFLPGGNVSYDDEGWEHDTVKFPPCINQSSIYR